MSDAGQWPSPVHAWWCADALNACNGNVFMYAPRPCTCRDLDYRGQVTLLKQAAVCLLEVHERGIVHGDVKLENFLVKAKVQGSRVQLATKVRQQGNRHCSSRSNSCWRAWQC